MKSKNTQNIKILLINAYSAKNRGDAGIVVAMIHILRSTFPECEITVMSSYWKENSDFYNQYNAKSASSVWNLIESKSTLSRTLKGLKFFIKAIFKPNSTNFSQYHTADLICSVGGGYLYSSRKGPLGIGLVNALYHYWLGERLGKTVIAFPQSVGPLNSFLDRLLSKIVLKQVFHIFSRDEDTTKTLKYLGLSNFSESPDIALTLEKGAPQNKFIGTPKIGITVLDWGFSKNGTTKTDIDLYLAKLAEIIFFILTTYPKGQIYLFPQVDVATGDSDFDVSKKLKEIVNSENCNIYSLNSCQSPEEIIAIYSEMDCFIGSRLHSAIFAIVGETPTIGLAYQPKTYGTFKHLGIENYVLNIDKFTIEELKALIRSCINGEQNLPLNLINQNRQNIIKLLNLAIKK